MCQPLPPDAVQQKLVIVTQSCEDGVCCEIRFSIDQYLFKKHLMGKHNSARYEYVYLYTFCFPFQHLNMLLSWMLDPAVENVL